MATLREVKNDSSLRHAKRLHNLLFGGDEELDWEENRVWLLWEKGKPIGFCSYKISSFNECFFSRAGVLKEHRGKGYHRRMIQHRLRKAKEEGCQFAITYTLIDNAASFVHLQKYFELYVPDYKYAGKVLYWRREL